jgi:hypothetical protein
MAALAPGASLRLLLLALLAPWLLCAQNGQNAKPAELLQYGIEWRFVRAGIATLSRTPNAQGAQSELKLESAGLVNTLYRVNDYYKVLHDPGVCAFSTYMRAEEGSRRRETHVTFDNSTHKSNYNEQDLVKNTTVLSQQLDIPACVHDVVAALGKLRSLRLPLGQSTQLPITDGKKLISARIEAQEKENVTTPAGTFSTIRYEANLFNGELYSRKGRLFIWVTDDEKRIPVQIRVKLNFPVGTISLALEKIGPS